MVYIILFIFSFLCTFIVKKYAIKYSMIANVNSRGSHEIPTAHGGGIAIALTWFMGIGYLYYTQQIEKSLFYALLVGLIICITSFIDDLYNLRPKLRLFIQSIASILGLICLGGFQELNFGFLAIEASVVLNIFAFLLIIWYINLFNFLDGINGYAGCEAVFLGLSGFILFGENHFIVLIVSVLGFLFWNYNKAKIFMGDVGSTLLGYNIAIFTIYYGNLEKDNFWIWIILFGLFWFDATVTLLRRIYNKEKVTNAHKKHAYQRLTQLGWSHVKVTNYAMGINLILFILIKSELSYGVSFIVSILVLFSIMRLIDFKKPF